jgi:class 3 adenylate cyclase/tetratricopeptide (TPR) repeat protein
MTRCPACRADIAPSSKFCSECGARVQGLQEQGRTSQASSAIVTEPETSRKNAAEVAALHGEGELRHLTVLFCDLVDSTGLAGQFDLEQWHEIVAAYQKAAADAVIGFDGHVAKYLGDGLLAFFGWPIARENDAEKSARAGLAILDALARLSRTISEAGLVVRVGIHSGPVFIGRGPDREADVFGQVPAIAERVQALAAPGTVVVTGATHRLIAGLFAVEDLGERVLKGLAAPIELFRVLRATGVRGRIHAAAAQGLTPLVGRDDELQMIWRRWELARDGDGQVVHITGEAGIGKSRLVQEFQSRIASRPHTWLECTCDSDFQSVPFFPIVEMLQRSLHWEKQSAAQRTQTVKRRLELAGIHEGEALEVFAELLDLPLPDNRRAVAASQFESRKRLLSMLANFYLGSSRVQPMVIAVEDLQWADASTVEWIETLAEQGANACLMLLCTSRLDFREPLRAHHLQLTLPRLSRAEVSRIVSEVVGQGRLSAEIVKAIVKRSAGVPLFVEELARLAIESGESSAEQIPATLADSLMARLDRLGRAKEIAQIGAVIGSSFSHELIAGVYDGEPDELQDALQRLIDSDLLHTTGAAPEAVIYHFKHALVQDTAYAALLKSRRRELHRRTATLIAERLPQTAADHPEVLARHWTGAGELEKALTAWSSAGRVARKRRAFREAERAYQRALEIIGKLPESPERDALELPVVAALAQVSALTHGYAAAATKNASSRALALVRRIGNVGQLSIQLSGTWAAAINGGDYRSADALSREFIELAEREGNPINLALAHMARIETHFYLGELAEAETRFERGRAFFDEKVFQQFPGALGTALAFASLTAFASGRIETALTRIDEAARFVQQHNNPYDQAYISYQTGALKLLIGEPTEAVAPAREAINLSDEHGFPHIAAAARTTMGAALANCGEPGQGVQLIEESLNAFGETETRMSVTLSLLYLAQAQALQGATDKALHTIERALEANPDEIIYRPEVLRLRGEFRLRVGDREQASADFGEAITCAHGMGAKSFELRAALSKARLLLSSGDRPGALKLLAPIYKGFAEGLDSRDLVQARVVLQGIGGRVTATER